MGSIDGKTQGFLPANYLKIMGKKQGTKSTSIENQQETKESNSASTTDLEQVFQDN